MAQVNDYKDMVIRWRGHPKYNSTMIIEDNAVEVLVQKLEMILFTNKKEVFGDDGYGLGADLEYLLWQTKISNDVLRSKITKQINYYCPELNIIGYTFNIELYEGTVRDILFLNFKIKGYNIQFVFN